MKELIKRILGGYELTKEEALALFKEDLETLTKAAAEVKTYFCGNHFDFCGIVNGKSGMCSENCTYCAQSSHYHTAVETYPLLEKEAFLEDAMNYQAQGVSKYSIVTSGKRLSKAEVALVCEVYKVLNDEVGIRLCASHGLLDEEDFKVLKAAGVKRYHNNLESSRRHFSSLCTTHTYDEKITTIKAAQKVGLEICSGGILGLGESEEDRIDLAFELKALNVDSIPLNLLSPIKGTPLEHIEPIGEEAFLKTAAIFRLIHPTKVIRLAGGRNLLSYYGKKAFEGGINGTITGDLLTTCGNNIKEDQGLVKSLGYHY